MEYETVVGIDLHGEMLDCARRRTSEATLVRSDLLEYEPTEPFDVVALFGALFHFTDYGAITRLFEHAHGLLRRGGVFVCDFKDVATLVDGYTPTATFESDAFRVERRTTSRLDDDDGRFTMRFEYDVTDRRRGKSARLEAPVSVRAFDPEELTGTAEAAGFCEATVRDGSNHDGVLVARR